MSDILKVARFLYRYSSGSRARWVFAGVVLIGIIGGLANTALLAVVNRLLPTAGGPNALLVGIFLGLCLMVPLSRYGSTMLLVRLTERTVYEARLDLCRRILGAPLRQLERLGSHRLLATLTDDVRAISESLSMLPMLLMHLAIVAGCVAYLGWLSGTALLAFLGFLVFGVLTYRLPLSWALRYVRTSRAAWDGLVRHLQGLTGGIKELKLNAERRHLFLEDDLEPVARDYRESNLRGNSIAAAAHSWGQILFFLAIGFLLIVLPRIHEVDATTLTGYTLTILYLTMPLETILNLLPMVNRARVAVEAIENLDLEPEGDLLESGSVASSGWSHLELRSVRYHYQGATATESFGVGPCDLKLEPGELVFLVGGNGSGKTTLAKLLIGLYSPEEGQIFVDGQPVDSESRDRYRQMFSTVFADFHLFDRLVGERSPELDRLAEEYLAGLQLDHKVEVQDSRLSTLDLSQGQRKRLALLNAYLEDRSIYVFDEWAADQDPRFKEIFYRRLLPELKRRGKAVVAISHDDRYYPLADRVLHMENGRILFDGSVEAYFTEDEAGRLQERLRGDSEWSEPVSTPVPLQAPGLASSTLEDPEKIT